MAYCRIGEEDSQVYAYKGGGEWHVYTDDGQAFTESTILGLLRLLVNLRDGGLSVPERAIERATREAEQ